MAIDYVVPPRVRQKFTHAPEPITTDFNTNGASHASTSYIGLREETWKYKHILKELLGPKYGFTHCPWTGDSAIPITDREGRVITVMAGHPTDPNWNEPQLEASDCLETLQPQCCLTTDQQTH
ncbi:hypothetical protein ARMGADRAFT_1089804 [Armillaria gallica]|uniref:Uncharacterized protein n=1 Tax=Armillaria gallica TaxID=47427 RepID=A0A2H3CV30_ARMGA|nr:hypothetical protein ARMGADRAFT_1089804 [Armillaria gallica]